MIYLYTDFGAGDIYVGQVKAALAQHAPSVSVIDIFHDAPAFQITANAHLLAALCQRLPPGSVVCAVVDPGVGGDRDGVVIATDDRYFVGPDNGLLSVVAARASILHVWKIQWQPALLSASFHGRDVFAPIAAWIAAGKFPTDKLSGLAKLGVETAPDDLAQIIYIDHYGNAYTGLRCAALGAAPTLTIKGNRLPRARTFSDVALGGAFWYENSLGLAEIAINQGSAAARFGLQIGDAVWV